ncbi:MAG: GNAT family N-acetyltransferase [Steroidobacteraceae bacterium]
MAQSLMLRPPHSGASILARVIQRLRHGLLTQEILDRLARAGIVIYPYFIAVEAANPGPLAPPDPRYDLRTLTAADAPAVSFVTRLKTHGTSVPALAARMQRAKCIGAFTDGKLVGYTWIGYDGLPIPASGRRWLFMLAPEETVLFDLYVAPEHRGNRLAALLRDAVTRVLEADGCTRAYTVRLAFNRATRRFQRRFAVHDAELRLYLHLRLARLPGIDLRLRRFGAAIRAPGVRRVPARPASRRLTS